MTALERVPVYAQVMEIVDHISDHVDMHGGHLEDLVSSQTKGIYAGLAPAERALVVVALAQQDAAPRAAAACYLLGKGGVRDLESFCALVDMGGENRDYLVEVMHWAEVVGSRADISHLVRPVADIEGLLASRPWWCLEVLDTLVGMGPEAPDCLWRHFLAGAENDVKDAACLECLARGVQTYEDEEASYYHLYALVLRVAGYFRRDSPWLQELLMTGSASALWLVADEIVADEIATAEAIFVTDDAFQSVEDLISRQPDAARREAMLTVARWARERLLRILSRSDKSGAIDSPIRTLIAVGGTD